MLRALYFVCVCFPKLFFFSGDDFSANLKDMRGDADQIDEVRNRRASNTRFGRSANALGWS